VAACFTPDLVGDHPRILDHVTGATNGDSPLVLGAELLAPIGDWTPAEAVIDDASIVVVDGDVKPSPVLRRFLQRSVALTIGHGPQDVGCDLWSTDGQEVEDWIAAARLHPQASVAAALLLRHRHEDIWAGLVAESATYSLLQSGPEFTSWLRSPGRPRPGTDTASRVRTNPAAPGRAAEVVLTRSARHNALDVQMRDELLAALGELRHQTSPIVVLAEGRSFCSGGDLGQFGSFEDPSSAHAVRLRRSLALRFSELAERMVVGLHGACLGAGIELPAFAGRVVASDDARLGLPEGGLGLIPGAGGTVSIPRRIGRARTLDLIVTGRSIDAATARAWGLVDEVVPRSQLEQRAREAAG
jgi:enoyl-CoA hydratase/carnithine racemase